jgi:hypothetical protein
MAACPSRESALDNGEPYKGKLDIDIGDYKDQLAAWNSQNMRDYQLMVELWDYQPHEALITVKNRIPESIVYPWGSWFLGASTIPEFYALIKKREKRIRDEYDSDNSSSSSLKVRYDTEYHYPDTITRTFGYRTIEQWRISLMPLKKGELEIDIGDYEEQLAAWNSQNMIDYRLVVGLYSGYYNRYSRYPFTGYFNVTNGIPDNSNPNSYYKDKKTIPEIYSFIKEEEEKIRNAYNGINRSYLNVQYDAKYHYPVRITAGIDHLFGEYWQWGIGLTNLGENHE